MVYANNIVSVMENECDTETLSAQAEAVKDILDEGGSNILNQDQLDQFADKMFAFIQQSESRIEENTKYEKENCTGKEDEDLDEEDLQLLKEENKNEE
jgi:hypothetical protein